MSQAANSSAPQKPGPNNVPDGIAKGILGLVVGAGLTFLGMHFYGPRLVHPVVEMAGPMPGTGGPGPGGTGIGGVSPSMGMGGGGGMGGGAGGGGAGGGGAGGGGKRNLTQLVGKLELLSRDHLNLHVELDADQSEKLAAELAALDKAETLTADEAQEHLDALEALLKPEQKEAVDAIGMPRPAGGGMGGGGPPAPDQNPFTQEANQKRLQDLLGRLKPAGAEAPAGVP